MKKAGLIIVCVIVVAVAAVIGSRFLRPSGPRTTEPFTFDYKLDAEGVNALTQGDDMSMLLASSPFYGGGRRMPGQRTQDFDEARARKVDQIIAESDALASKAIGLKSDVEELRKALCDYLTVCAKNDPKTRTFVSGAGKEILRVYTLETVVEAEYKSIDTSSTDAFTHSYMEYLKCAKAVQLAALYLQDIDNIAAFAAVGVDSLSATSNPKIAEANKQLDDAMAGVDKMSGAISDVMSGMIRVDHGFKQLATGDYYYARTAVKFMRDSMPRLKAAAAGMKPNKYMDAQSVAFTKDYLNKFDGLSADIQRYLDSVPQSSILPVTASGSAPFDCAFASYPPSDYGKAYASVADPGKDAGAAKPGWLASGWNGLKNLVHGTQSVIGVGIDVAGTAVKNITRVGAGIYYGNSAKEIWKDMKDNSQQIITNWQNNKSGSETLRTAHGYFDDVDNGAEYVGGAGAEKIFGKGWTSWGVGKVSGLASGILTGLGKGIVLVGNRDASASDYVVGTIEIAGASIGGSKLILKGSMVPGFLKGLTKGAWISAKGAWNAAATMAGTLEREEIETALVSAIKNGISRSEVYSRALANQAMMTAIAESNQALKAEMSTIITDGLKAGWINFNGTLRDSLFEFTKKQFANNLKGLLTTLGAHPTEFMDNIIGQWADDVLKDLVDQAMAEAPIAAELKGVWTGTTVFTSIQVPEAAEAKAEKEGCDIAGAFKKLQGKSLGTTMHLDGSPSGSGSMSLTIAFQGKGGGSPIAGRYNYKEGAFSVNQAIKGGSISLHGDAKRMTQGYELPGTIRIVISGGGTAAITMSGNFSLAKGH